MNEESKRAANNIFNVLLTGRIEMQGSPLTLQELDELRNNLTLLANKAQLADTPEAESAGEDNVIPIESGKD